MPESKQRSSIKTDEEGIVMKNSQVDDLRNELTAIDFKLAARTAEMVVLEKYAVCIGSGSSPH